jgi:MacB-like periplasmic core domain
MFLIADFDSGFDTRDLLLVTVNTAASANTPANNMALLDTMADKLHQVPGVSRVTYARSAPREFWGSVGVSLPGSAQVLVRAESTRVGPNYLSVFGAAPLAGRDFAPEDQRRSTSAIVITQNLAERLWPAQSPLGRTLVVNKQERDVVGVMPNLFFSGFRREHPGFVMLFAQQEPLEPGEATLYVRYSGSLDTIGPAISVALRQVDARTPVAYMADTRVDDAADGFRRRVSLHRGNRPVRGGGVRHASEGARGGPSHGARRIVAASTHPSDPRRVHADRYWIVVGFPAEPRGGHSARRRALRNHGDRSCDIRSRVCLALCGLASGVLSPRPPGGEDQPDDGSQS